MSKNNTVICIVGPTGTGKSATAIELARTVNGVIINADSRQLYGDFPIITAQPTPAERAQCPHVLYGTLPIATPSTAGYWAEEAGRAIADTLTHGMTPILVGGTGMYLRALFDGIAEIPPIPEELLHELEDIFAQDCGETLYTELTRVDPGYACRIHAHDKQRNIRAMGVFKATGKTFSWWHTQTPPPSSYRIIRLAIGLPLAELEPRLDARIEFMLKEGALNEVQKARTVCDDPSAPGWSGIGCAELYKYSIGKFSFEEARALWLKNTRAYAKRQLTWFRADDRILWFKPQERQKIIDTAVEMLSI